MKKIHVPTMLSVIISAFFATFTTSCEMSGNGQDIDFGAARIEYPDRILAGDRLYFHTALDAGEDVVETASILIDNKEMETFISYDRNTDTYNFSCIVPEDCRGEYSLSLILNSGTALEGSLKVYTMEEEPASTASPLKIDISGAYLLIGEGKLTENGMERIRILDVHGNAVPGKPYDFNGGSKNISDRYSFISLEHATSYDVIFPDNDEYAAVVNYSYDVDNYIMINSSGLLLPFRESGMFRVRSLSENSFCFWTGDSGAPLMQATVYEDDIPSEITDPERELACLHITDLNGTEGRISLSDIGKYGFNAAGTDAHDVKVFLNNGEVCYGSRIVEMPLVSEADLSSNKELVGKVFTVGDELMAITYTNSLYKLFQADPENRRWSRIGEWERDNRDRSDLLSVAVQGDKAIIVSNNKECRFVSGGQFDTYDLSWGDRFDTMEIYTDPVINETGTWLYFYGRGNDSGMYRSRISGTVLGSPEKLGNGDVPQFMFHVLDDIVVMNTGTTGEGQPIFRIIADGNETEVADTERLAGSGGISYDMGVILNPGK